MFANYPVPPRTEQGLYAFVKGSEVAYVGRASCMRQRLGTHHKLNDVEPDAIYFCPFPDASEVQLFALEKFFIWSFPNACNKHGRRSSMPKETVESAVIEYLKPTRYFALCEWIVANGGVPFSTPKVKAVISRYLVTT